MIRVKKSIINGCATPVDDEGTPIKLPVSPFGMLSNETEYLIFETQAEASEFMPSITPQLEAPTWKIKAVLAGMGLLASVESALESLEEPNKSMAKVAWSQSATVVDSSLTVQFVKNVLTLTDEQVREIFETANNLSI